MYPYVCNSFSQFCFLNTVSIYDCINWQFTSPSHLQTCTLVPLSILISFILILLFLHLLFTICKALSGCSYFLMSTFRSLPSPMQSRLQSSSEHVFIAPALTSSMSLNSVRALLVATTCNWANCVGGHKA